MATLQVGSILILAGIPVHGAGTARVEVQNGNVVLVDGGQRHQLTTSGRDADPVLSPDGKWVAFTRRGNPSSTGMQGDCKSGSQADLLLRIQADGASERVLVQGQSGETPQQSLCEFGRKQFSSDGRYLYFLSPAWATSDALHAYDTRAQNLRFVLPANDVIVLNSCESDKFRDNLVVQQHRYFVVAGSFDWYWLYDRNGSTEIGPVGDYDGEKNVREAIEGSGLCDRDRT
jgi:hypothetical protein